MSKKNSKRIALLVRVIFSQKYYIFQKINIALTLNLEDYPEKKEPSKNESDQSKAYLEDAKKEKKDNKTKKEKNKMDNENKENPEPDQKKSK